MSGNRKSFWEIRAPPALAWRAWDGEIVVYNELTGSTHHLGALGSAVLSLLIRHPAPVEMSALLDAVAENFEVPADTPLQPEIERALIELARLGLAIRSSH